MKQKPLKGVRILDLTRLLPGPMCTLHLADMGAEVIKMEDTSVGDYARFIPPIQNKNSFFFNAVNRNKRSVAIDYTNEQGRAIVLKLIETADVLVESFRPGVMKKLNLDYETVKSINPRLIYCSITGYGQTGPYSHKAGHDINFCAYAGVLNIKNKTPSISNFQLGDIVGGTLNAAMAILAALVQQKVSGEGQYLDVSMLDGLLAHNTTSLAQIENDETNFLTGILPCYSIFETADNKYIALGALEFKFWERFCNAINRHDLIKHHMVVESEAEWVFKELADFFRSNTRDYWDEKFKHLDCCVSPILSLKEAMNNEQVIARQMVKISTTEEGEVTQFALPIKSSGFDFTIENQAPQLGEHTIQLLQEMGLSELDIKKLKQNQVIL